MGQPNELPEGGEGGSTGGSWWWWRGPNPAELPVDFTRSLFEEVVSLRSRITGLENALTMVKITGRFGGIGGPAEYPNPEDIGTGGGGFRPPINEIAEFPIPDFATKAINSLIDQRLTAFSTQILGEIKGLREEIQGLKR